MPDTFERGGLTVIRNDKMCVFTIGYAVALDPDSVQELLDWLQPPLNTRVAQEVMERAPSPDYTPETNESQAFEAFRHALPEGVKWCVTPNSIVWVEDVAIGAGPTLAVAFCHAALHLVDQ